MTEYWMTASVYQCHYTLKHVVYMVCLTCERLKISHWIYQFYRYVIHG